jgi:hypothetical protein
MPEQKLDHIEELVITMVEQLKKHMDEMLAAFPSQFQQFCVENPSHASFSQVMSLPSSLLENLPKKQPTKATSPSPLPLENLPKTQNKDTSWPNPKALLPDKPFTTRRTSLTRPNNYPRASPPTLKATNRNQWRNFYGQEQGCVI